ncbi:LCP family protein [Streptomyces paromomycinus]|uniref:Membrane protein n=1 Tax=Streptomyces paromomycinus TaxID=92743 RepID=A0A401W958_STREY|nr:LCP family protein [Streptomyces paromomycinus]GCD45841.1 membrane protein [Streptomyces paromomycinus]
MNDRHDPYVPRDPYAQDQQGQPGYTYDAYGQPVYPEAPQQAAYDQYGQPVGYDPYGAPGPYDPYGRQPGGQPGAGQQIPEQQGAGQGYGYDPYGHQQVPQQTPQQAEYQQQYDPYGQPQQFHQPQQTQQHGVPQQQAPQQTPQQHQQQHQQGWIPQQSAQPSYEQVSYQEPEHQPYGQPARESATQAPHDGAPGAAGATGRASAQEAAQGPGGAAGGTDYRTEQFSFIEEPAEESEDVIDWLKFTESRTERREEAKRRGRSRKVMLIVLLVLLLLGGVGYLWWAGKLPGLSGAGAGKEAGGAGQKRDVLVVHLKDPKGNSSTALLVDNESTHKGTTVLLPNSLAVSTEDGGSTTLAKSVKDQGIDPTREALNTLFGADIKASWRLDTPYLENLVETTGGITLDTDTTVPGAKKGDGPLVKQGKSQELNGQAAVAYATFQAPGEPQTKQLERFGQVMQATLKKVSSDADGATATVKSLLQVLDPPLTEAELGSSLAQRAELAKSGAYGTTLLPVQQDGTLSRQAADGVVKEVLGGTVKKADPSSTPRVSVQNATGKKEATDKARIALVNGGYSFVEGGTAAARPASEVTYADAAQKAKAEEAAKTLGLPAGAVKQGKTASNADVTVVLGQDYKG